MNITQHAVQGIEKLIMTLAIELVKEDWASTSRKEWQEVTPASLYALSCSFTVNDVEAYIMNGVKPNCDPRISKDIVNCSNAYIHKARMEIKRALITWLAKESL